MESAKFLSDLAEKHGIECREPRACAGLLEKLFSVLWAKQSKQVTARQGSGEGLTSAKNVQRAEAFGFSVGRSKRREGCL